MKSLTIPYKRKVKFPMICACCLKQCTSNDEVFRISTIAPSVAKSRVFEIPTCNFCQIHWKQSNRYNHISRWLFGLSMFMVVGLSITTYKSYQSYGLGTTLIVALLGLAIIFGIMELIKLPFKPKKINQPGHLDRKTEPVIAELRIKGNKEFITFSFGNDEYFTKFLEINSL